MISKVDMYLVSLLDVSIYHLYQSIIHLIYNYTFKYINIHGAYYFIGLRLFTPLSGKKRGLSHAHILIFLHPSNKYPNPKNIDNIISAEIPNKGTCPELYELVNKHMIHGPCGLPNRRAPCMVDGKCIRFFPKKF